MDPKGGASKTRPTWISAYTDLLDQDYPLALWRSASAGVRFAARAAPQPPRPRTTGAPNTRPRSASSPKFGPLDPLPSHRALAVRAAAAYKSLMAGSYFRVERISSSGAFYRLQNGARQTTTGSATTGSCGPGPTRRAGPRAC